MLTLNALPDALLDRFLNDCAIGPVGRADRIGIAVSGGPDSMALLLLAHGTFGTQVAAATVDHKLRPESEHEAAFVASVCEDLGVPHTTLSLKLPYAKGNVSALARELRYAQLHEWREEAGLDWLLTGHHADDQLETIVMRLNRGAGVGGLSGIRGRHGRVLRPLLGWRHVELADLVTRAGFRAVDDPSNRDDRYDRARLRKALGTADWLDPIAVNHAAAALEEADDAIAWSARFWAKARVRREGDSLSFDPLDLPPELQRRILISLLKALNSKAKPTGPKLSRLLASLRSGAKATLDGVAFDARGGMWVATLAPPRRPVN